MDHQIFGMPSLVEFDSLYDNVKLCNELGLDFIELNMNLPQFQLHNLNIRELISFKETYGIFFTFHLPEEIDIANFNQHVRKAYQYTVWQTIETSAALSCPLINMHLNLGTYFTLPGKRVYLYEKYFQDYFGAVAEFSENSRKIIGGYDIKICLENTGIYKYNFISETVSYLLKDQCFCLTWDVGHDHSSGNSDSSIILANMNKLKHMHLHDGIEKNNHLPLFTGEIDLMEKLRIVEQNKLSCIIETKTSEGLRHSVSELKKLGYSFRQND